jgi:drug/metabolite transporter (DMT)-like permease
MSTSGAAAGLGLLSATSWGASDFVGGMGARRFPALLVVVSGHLVSLLVLLAICFGAHLDLPGKHDMLLAAIGGFEGALSLALFYHALALGAMGLTAALTGLLTALIPVLFSIYQEGLSSRLTATGLALGLVAMWLITHTSAASNGFQGKAAVPLLALLWGALAGLGFGTQLILFKLCGAGSILWVMTSSRAAGVAAMLLMIVLLPPGKPWRGFWLFGILAGTFDTAGNLFYIQTTRLGRLDAAAVICSLYPAVTILLASMLLREWPSRMQITGIGIALAAVALLSV